MMIDISISMCVQIIVFVAEAFVWNLQVIRLFFKV